MAAAMLIHTLKATLFRNSMFVFSLLSQGRTTSLKWKRVERPIILSTKFSPAFSTTTVQHCTPEDRSGTDDKVNDGNESPDILAEQSTMENKLQNQSGHINENIAQLIDFVSNIPQGETKKKRGSTKFTPRLTYKKMVAERMKQAKKSILLHIPVNLTVDKICSPYGTITNIEYLKMNHAQTEDDKQYKCVLVVYKEQDSVKKLCEAALEQMSEDSENQFPLSVICVDDNGQFTDMASSKFQGANPNTYSRLLRRKLHDKRDLFQQIGVLNEAVQAKEPEKSLGFYICNQVELAIQTVYPDTQVFLCGSSTSGLGIVGKDLDMAVHCPFLAPEVENDRDMSDTNHQETHSGQQDVKLETMKVMSNTISRLLPLEQMEEIFHSKVPLLQFVFTPTGTKCDLNLNLHIRPDEINKASELMYTLGKYEPKFPVLLRTVKYWAKAMRLTGTGITKQPRSYSYTLMVIFYLQRHGLLPPLRMVIEELEKGENATQSHWKKRNVVSIDHLLIGFFEFYSNFSLHRYAIHPLTGRYEVKAQRLRTCLQIIDPLNVHNCVSKNVTFRNLWAMKLAFRKTASFLRHSNFWNGKSKGLAVFLEESSIIENQLSSQIHGGKIPHLHAESQDHKTADTQEPVFNDLDGTVQALIRTINPVMVSSDLENVQGHSRTINPAVISSDLEMENHTKVYSDLENKAQGRTTGMSLPLGRYPDPECSREVLEDVKSRLLNILKDDDFLGKSETSNNSDMDEEPIKNSHPASVSQTWNKVDRDTGIDVMQTYRNQREVDVMSSQKEVRRTGDILSSETKISDSEESLEDVINIIKKNF